MMKCLECQDLLQRRLDGETLGSAAALAKHLAGCPSCRLLHASADTLLAGLAALPSPTLSAGFSQRMLLAVSHDRQVRRRRIKLRLRLTAALAASVVVMALAGYFLLPVPRNTSGEHAPIAVDGKKEAPGPAPLPKSDDALLAKSAEEARRAFSTLSERWADKAKEQTRILLSAANPLELADLENLPDMADALELQPAVLAFRQTGHEVAEGLEPVTTTARRALAYFVRELPVLPTKQ